MAQGTDSLVTPAGQDTAVIVDLAKVAQVNTVDSMSREFEAALNISGLFFANPTYRISIGASFDFIDKFKANNIYGDLIVDLPEVIRSKRATSGFLGGVYQVRSVSVDSFLPEQVYLAGSIPLYDPAVGVPGDSSILQLSRASGVKRIVADHLHFFANLYRPWHLTDGIPGSSGLYHLFHFSSIRTREQVSERYAPTPTDSLIVGNDAAWPGFPQDRSYRRVFTHWQVGCGQMLRHELDELALQIQGLVTCIPATLQIGYQVSFNTIGSRSGLILGAEMRSDPHNGGERYNIFLAKTFKLADMADLITSY